MIIDMMTSLIWWHNWYDEIIDMMRSLTWSNHWHDQIIDMIKSLTWSNHWHDQIIDMIKSLTWSYHWHDQIIYMIKSLTWSNHWHDQIIDMIKSLIWSHQWWDHINIYHIDIIIARVYKRTIYIWTHPIQTIRTIDRPRSMGKLIHLFKIVPTIWQWPLKDERAAIIMNLEARFGLRFEKFVLHWW